MSKKDRPETEPIEPIQSIPGLEQIKTDDPVNPSHYQGDLVARIIEHFNLPIWSATALKYILRFQKKNGVEDLKKAVWYLNREISLLEGETFPITDWGLKDYNIAAAEISTATVEIVTGNNVPMTMRRIVDHNISRSRDDIRPFKEGMMYRELDEWYTPNYFSDNKYVFDNITLGKNGLIIQMHEHNRLNIFLATEKAMN